MSTGCFSKRELPCMLRSYPRIWRSILMKLYGGHGRRLTWLRVLWWSEHGLKRKRETTGHQSGGQARLDGNEHQPHPHPQTHAHTLVDEIRAHPRAWEHEKIRRRACVGGPSIHPQRFQAGPRDLRPGPWNRVLMRWEGGLGWSDTFVKHRSRTRSSSSRCSFPTRLWAEAASGCGFEPRLPLSQPSYLIVNVVFECSEWGVCQFDQNHGFFRRICWREPPCLSPHQHSHCNWTEEERRLLPKTRTTTPRTTTTRPAQSRQHHPDLSDITTTTTTTTELHGLDRLRLAGWLELPYNSWSILIILLSIARFSNRRPACESPIRVQTQLTILSFDGDEDEDDVLRGFRGEVRVTNQRGTERKGYVGKERTWDLQNLR